MSVIIIIFLGDREGGNDMIWCGVCMGMWEKEGEEKFQEGSTYPAKSGRKEVGCSALPCLAGKQSMPDN